MFAQGYEKTKKFIASQGPKENTIDDFWRMIWEKRLETVVMLVKVTEARKVGKSNILGLFSA